MVGVDRGTAAGPHGLRADGEDLMAKGITIKNGKSGRQIKSALEAHDRTMHAGKKSPKITVKNGGKNGR